MVSKRMIRLFAAVLLCFLFVTGCQKSAQEEYEEAKESAEIMEQEYQRAKRDYDEVKSDLARLDELKQKIKEATPGTDEYDRLVAENNAIIMKLVDKYPEIADEVSVK